MREITVVRNVSVGIDSKSNRVTGIGKINR